MIKVKRNSPSKNISERSIISHSRSRQKSSSGDDKKSNSSLKKKLYKHVIFDKRHQPPNFKTLHRIRQQALEQQDVKWKSTEQLSLKDKLIEILEKQAEKNNKIRKNIVSIGQQPLIKTQEYIKLEKMGSFKQQEDKKTAKNEVQNDQNLLYKQPLQIIVTSFKATENRDQQILRRKLESNIKFLTSQTSQLLSFTKFMLLEADIDLTKKKMSQISIYLRQMRINMRNHQYTKQINFTFPVKKHNDEINVKMPEQISQSDKVRYRIVEQKLKHQNQMYQMQQQKINNLTKYYMNLLKRFDPIIDPKDILTKNESPKKINNQSPNKNLRKAKLFQQFTFKTNNKIESVCTSNSGSSNKKSQIRNFPNNINTEKSLAQNRYFTLRQKKQALIDSIQKQKKSIESKLNRLNEDVQLLQRQVSYLDENIERTQMKKNQLISEIQILRKKKMQIADQNRQNNQKYLQSIQNMTAERKLNYLKERYKTNLQNKGFTNQLRNNQSLSPQNYLSNTSRNFLASFSPRHLK